LDLLGFHDTQGLMTGRFSVANSRLDDDQLFRGIELVCFDFDGTLIDASRVICRSFNSVLLQRGAPSMEEREIRMLIGRPLAEMFRVALSDIDEESLEQCIQAYREVFFPLAVLLSRPLPGALPLIELLASQGKQLAVVTTRASDGARRILEGFHVDAHFQTIVGLEHVTWPKPDPEPVRLALERLCVAPEAAMMVGDTPDDIVAARAAGVVAVGVTSGAFEAAALEVAGPHRVVASLEHLVEIFPRGHG
jgi:HAD superfamily hydrolase (TIGR01509 family)